MNKYIFTFFLFLIAVSAIGQDFAHKAVNESTFGIYILTGYQYSHLSELNKQLASNNFDKINSNSLNLGTGMFVGLNRHSIEFYGRLYGSFEETEFNELGYKTSYFGYGAGLSYGFDFYLGGFIITPNIGFRRDKFKLELLSQNAIESDFDTNLNTLNNSNLTSDIFGITFGTKVLFEHDSESFNPGFLIAYTVPLKREWQVSGVELSNSPEINSAGFRVGIILQFYLKNYVD